MKVKNNFSEKDDYIFIDGFEVPCRVGITQHERDLPQILSISIRIYLPLYEAGRSDNLKLTADYAEIVQKIQTAIQSKEFHLVEAVAELVASKVLEEKKALAVDVNVGKKVFSDIASIGTHIHRSREKK